MEYDTKESRYGFCPSTVEPVDLGLYSGTMWANANLGYSKKKGYGDLGEIFSWGEPFTKDEFTKESYFSNEEPDSPYTGLNKRYYYEVNYEKNCLKPQFDAARQIWGAKWRIPSTEEWKELCDSCIIESCTSERYYFLKFTSKINGNHIILPIGVITKDENGRIKGIIRDTEGYWTRNYCLNDKAWGFICSHARDSCRRFNFVSCWVGYCIRPVWIA